VVPFSNILVTSGPRFLGRLISQRWTPARLARCQEARLEETLRAAMRIPFYRERFRRTPSARDLPGLPVLGREDISALNRSVRGLHPDRASFIADTSSGTTGEQAEFLFDESHQRGRYASRLRWLLDNGWNPLARSAWIIFIPAWMADMRPVEHRFFAGSRFLSIFTGEKEQIDWLCRLDPHFLVTYPSNLEALLDRVEAEGARPASLRRVFTWAELLHQDVRSRTRRVLGVPVSDIYGSAEAGLAWECRKGAYHQESEHVLLELVDDRNRPVGPGQVGKILVTTLENRLMPLIRYEIGDYAVPGQGACLCGRGLPLLDRIAGRPRDYLSIGTGQVAPARLLALCLGRIPGMPQYEMVQTEPLHFLFRHVSPDRLSDPMQQAIRKTLGSTLGHEPDIDWIRVPDLPKSRTGKVDRIFSLVTRTLPANPSFLDEPAS